MSAGAYRHRIRIEEAVDTQDQTTGEPVRTWTELATVWASIEPLKGREMLSDGALRGDLDTRIKIRWAPHLASLGTKARITRTDIAGRPDVLYNVVSASEPLLKRRTIEILCKSGTNEG